LSDSAITDSGNLNLHADGDANDYIFLDTTSNEEFIYFEDASLAYANDPGIKLNSTTGELEYRDENSSTWVTLDSLTDGTGPWTDGSGISYLTDAAEDLAVGGSALASPFSVDVDTNTVRIGDAVDDGNDPTILFYSSDASDYGSLEYSDYDAFYFNGGDIGVRTPIPQNDIHVNGAGGANAYIRMESVAAYDAGMVLVEDGNFRWYIYNDGDNADRIYVHNSIKNRGVYMVQNASGWVNVSDIRLKENITPIDNVLDKILSIDGFQYTLINDPGGSPEYGVSAQQVQEVFPYVVPVDGGEYLGVIYERFVPILIEAMKEQNQIFVQNQNQVDTRLNSIENEQNSLSSSLVQAIQDQQLHVDAYGDFVMQQEQINQENGLRITSLEEQLLSLNQEVQVFSVESLDLALNPQFAQLESDVYTIPGGMLAKLQVINPGLFAPDGTLLTQMTFAQVLSEITDYRLTAIESRLQNVEDRLTVVENIEQVQIPSEYETLTVTNTLSSSNVKTMDVNVLGQFIASDQMAGTIEVPAGVTEVEFVFASAYTKAPIVSLTPADSFIDGGYIVAGTTELGFTLKLENPQAQMVQFNYLIIGK